MSTVQEHIQIGTYVPKNVIHILDLIGLPKLDNDLDNNANEVALRRHNLLQNIDTAFDETWR